MQLGSFQRIEWMNAMQKLCGVGDIVKFFWHEEILKDKKRGRNSSGPFPVDQAFRSVIYRSTGRFGNANFLDQMLDVFRWLSRQFGNQHRCGEVKQSAYRTKGFG